MTAGRGVTAGVTVVSLCGVLLVLGAVDVTAQTLGAGEAGRSSTVPIAKTVRPVAAEEGVRWNKLKPGQREALLPLQQEWSGIDATRKQKWVQLADRMPSMPPDERGRVQARMSDWARLSPAERGQARLRYEEAQQVPSPDRRSRWEAYQALSPEQKRELAARAAAKRAQSASADANTRRPPLDGTRPERADRARDLPQAKSNIVPNPAYSAPARTVAPTVIQAAPGATTSLITRRPAPPPHQHTGLPKIAATPDFVNKSTLLPQRGAQGAAVRAIPGGEPASSARR